MPLIPFPSVPNAPGVPAILRDITTINANIVIAVADAIILARAFFGSPEWGLFDEDGELALKAESFNAVDIRKEYRLATHPIEDGQFQTYNKVEQPLEAKITYTHGGSVESRNEFIETVRNIVDGLELYTLVTPEFSCENVNATHFDFSKKTRSGATLMIVDVWVEEVRLTESSQYAEADKAQDAPAQPVHDNGTVAPSPPASTAVPPTPAAATPTAPLPTPPPGPPPTVNIPPTGLYVNPGTTGLTVPSPLGIL